MVALISFLLVVTLPLIVERVATVALGFVDAPHNATLIRPRDTLVLYGRAEPLAEISGRRSGPGGDQAHRDAVHTRGKSAGGNVMNGCGHRSRGPPPWGSQSPLKGEGEGSEPSPHEESDQT